MTHLITLRSDAVETVLDPEAGGRIASLRVDGLELLVTEGWGPVAWGCYPMVPWAGRVRDGLLRWRGESHPLPTHLIPPHAIHGTLLETAWEIVDAGPSSATLAADLGPPWPFGGRAVHRVIVTSAGLRAELEVHAGSRPMPAIAGWHPWFRRVLRDPAGAAVGPFELPRRRRAIATEWFERLDIRPRTPERMLGDFSGGNQQKVVLAKWLNSPELSALLLDHPLRGLDPGAAETVNEQVRAICDAGTAVVLIPDTIEEALEIADDIVVMRDGRISGTYDLGHDDPTTLDLLERML